MMFEPVSVSVVYEVDDVPRRRSAPLAVFVLRRDYGVRCFACTLDSLLTYLQRQHDGSQARHSQVAQDHHSQRARVGPMFPLANPSVRSSAGTSDVILAV